MLLRKIQIKYGSTIAGLVLLSALFISHAATAAGSLIITDLQPTPLSLTAAEVAYLKQYPTLRVATKPDWAPIDRWEQDGVYAGVSGEYLRLVATRLGLKLDVKQYASNTAALDALKAGQADLIPSLALTPERQAVVTFSSPYLDVPNAVFARKDVATFDVSGNWQGLEVAAEMGFAHVKNLRATKTGAAIQEYADTETALIAVARGEADVYMGALPTTAANIEKLLIGNIEVRGYVDSPFRLLRMGVARDKSLLLSAINRAMASITDDEADAIRQRWLPARTLLTYAKNAMPMTPAQRAWADKNSQLRVAYDPEMSPITFTDSNGKMSGLAHDYLKIVSKKLGLTVVEEKRGTWSEILAATQRGEVDVLVAAAMNQERLDYLDFAGPYLSSPSVLVDANRDVTASELEAFIGKKLAVQQDHFLVAEIARRHPGITLVNFPTMAAALAAVVAGECDGAMGNLHPISQLIETKFIGKLRISGNVARGDSVLYFATPKTKPELGQLLNLAKSTISQAERNEIRDRWLSVTYRPGYSARSIVNTAAPILAALLGALLVFFFLHHRLRKEMKRRNALVLELASRKMEAEAATQAKSRFLATMSHEIRTPMQGILGAADMLSRSQLLPAQAKLNSIVRDAAQNLVQMLNEILDERKLSEGHMAARLEACDVGDKIQGAVDVFAPSAANKSIALTLTIAPNVAPVYITDGTYIRQIVSNLVSNAIKFTKVGGVKVRLDASVDQNLATLVTNTLTITVEDTGAGMSAPEIAALFQPYTQGEAGHQSGMGTGLGLSICRDLAHLLGGTLTAESALGQGSTFTFIFSAAVATVADSIDEGSLNLNNTAISLKAIENLSRTVPGMPSLSNAAPARNILRASANKCRVLACEDDPLIRELMQDQFAELGAVADIAANANEGLDLWRNASIAYDIIFTDNNMGGMSGIEFARIIRAEEAAIGRTGRTSTPIVGITGSTMPTDIQKCLDIGMNRVLCKPVVMADLQIAIDELAAR
jgi:two-component system, NarL family, sensor histidine kinase EvgS